MPNLTSNDWAVINDWKAAANTELATREAEVVSLTATLADAKNRRDAAQLAAQKCAALCAKLQAL
jgi:hypothetical protein